MDLLKAFWMHGKNAVPIASTGPEAAHILESLRENVLADLIERTGIPASGPAVDRLMRLTDRFIEYERRQHPHTASLTKRCALGVGGGLEQKRIDELRRHLEGASTSDLAGSLDVQAVDSRLQQEVAVAFRRHYRRVSALKALTVSLTEANKNQVFGGALRLVGDTYQNVRARAVVVARRSRDFGTRFWMDAGTPEQKEHEPPTTK